ncbi:MAG: adenine deaminase [Schaedlerella sp.]|nr:adenine deaminase [Lachnospiraceae bacterium]MDY4202765.1 adenine deaminase [Schaedlerella sp.]
MMKEELKKIIDVAAGRIPADVVIKNCRIVNVFTGEISDGTIAFCEGQIAGIGDYEGQKEFDAEGRYAVPGFIDSHIHIESSYVRPEEIGRLLVPHGTSTIVADPHEIVNVCGIKGLDYMMEAAKRTALDIKYMLPSCVPAAPFEDAGAVIGAAEMEEPILREGILGLGEFMNFPGVINAADSDLEKIIIAKKAGKPIDGHVPGISGKELNAYASTGILTDHECSTVQEMKERLERGMYVLMRQGSACHNLRTLLKGLTPENSRRCLLCSDDRQPRTILHEGHLDNHLRICIDEGVDPVTAIRMATLNAAECYGLKDRGAIAPGYRADVVLLDDLKDFHVSRVWIGGELTAEEGRYLPEIEFYDTSSVKGSVVLKDFSAEKFKMHLKSNVINAIGILPGGVVTEKLEEKIELDKNGEFVRNPEVDLVKVAVVERHHGTGKAACGFLKGYGIKKGAIAVSVAHDSHNIIVVGISDEEMEFAVNSLARQEGGIVLVKEGKVIESMPLPIAGLMSEESGEWVEKKLTDIHEKAASELGISGEVEPVMTLCFMSLPVIPELKLTARGLFDVTSFSFIPVEHE